MANEAKQQQKAKAYDEALEKARIASKEDKHLEATLERIFPELKEESEDERIEKELIEHIKTNRESGFILFQKVSPDEVIAWLEKQGEQPNKVSIWKHWSNGIGGNGDGELIYLVKSGNTYMLSSCLGFECDYIELSELDKLYVEQQGEQKSVDNAEPKFNVGDWVTNNCAVWRIENIHDGLYDLKGPNGGTMKNVESKTLIDTNFHLWTIQDAKKGDVLAFNDDTIVIFKDLYNSTSFHSYCHIEDGIFGINDEDLPDWWESEGFQPATKKQRDILFQKMKEARYELDSEKKELKKIEQKTTEWTDKDWSYYNKLESFLEVQEHYSPTESSSGYQKDVHETLLWLKSLRPKHVAWSEEDEKILEILINDTEKTLFAIKQEERPDIMSGLSEIYIERLRWLKSLKKKD